MGWSIGYDEKWQRDIGYGVPAICDYPGCNTEIDRGLSYVCGGEPYGGEHGCGLYFCEEHRDYYDMENGDCVEVCNRCATGEKPFEPKPDTTEWIEWKLNDSSWQQWRNENPKEVKNMRQILIERKAGNSDA